MSYEVMYMWNLKKKGKKESIYKREIESRMYKTSLWLPSGEKEEG